MTLARLLVAGFMICSLPALAQDQQSHRAPSTFQSSSSGMQRGLDFRTPAEPWRIIPPPAYLGAANRDQILAKQFTIDPKRNFKPQDGSLTFLRGMDRQLDTDTTCYAIRSYVVERDSKDSDSTHPAGYSTCRPSDRYHVKSAEIRIVPAER